eukprot:1157041-Pelagomonas_calceolata.AAC.7
MGVSLHDIKKLPIYHLSLTKVGHPGHSAFTSQARSITPEIDACVLRTDPSFDNPSNRGTDCSVSH